MYGSPVSGATSGEAQLGGHRNYYHYTFAQTFSAVLGILIPKDLLVLLA